MNENKWSKFTIIADFDTHVRNIYEAWATPTGLESWFLRKAEFYSIAMRLKGPDEFIAGDDTYNWYWHGYEDMQAGEILEANGLNFLKFTFTEGTIISITIEFKNGLTMLELTQENIPEESDPSKNLFIQCQTGWTFYLANLKSIIEGGIDLRNKRFDVKSNFK